MKGDAGRTLRSPGIAAWVLLVCCVLEGCHAQQPWPLWEAYTQRFLDPQGRIIDRTAHDRTTSEGQAYALFFALVDDDKARFEKILAWTEANLAGGDLAGRLPAWEWGQTSDGQWKTIDDNSAADADLWTAYTLIEAGRLWRDPRYDRLGRALAERIAREEVVLIPGVGTTLAPGPHGFQTSPDSYVLNPSYLPLPVLTYLSRALPEGPWAAVAESLPRLLSADVAHGFAMDWVAAGRNGVHAATPPLEPTAGAREPQPSGSYDAIRVYLWLGIADPGTRGERELLGQVSGMAGYLRTAASPPLEVDPEGNVVHAVSSAGFSAAVVPYLNVVGMKAQAKGQQERLLQTRDAASGLYGRPGEYYDENLALFSTGWSDQRYRLDRDGKLHLKWK